MDPKQPTVVNPLIDLNLIRELVLGAAEPRSPGPHKQFVFVPAGFEEAEIPALHEIELPDHIRQRLTLVECESFTDYVKRFKGSTTVIFGTKTAHGAQFVAVLDYHESGAERKANHTRHIADFNPEFSDEFQAWLSINGKGMTQDQFLDHLRRWGDVITSHTDADMVEIVSNLEFTTSGSFSSKVERVTGGKKLLYNEVVEGTTQSKQTQIPVPDRMKMRSEVFAGGAEFDYEADLLYRIGGGRLTISIELKRPHKVIKDAIESLITDIEAETGIDVLLGTVALPS